MARHILDQSGNEDLGRTLSKINENFAEIFAKLDALAGPAPVVPSPLPPPPPPPPPPVDDGN